MKTPTSRSSPIDAQVIPQNPYEARIAAPDMAAVLSLEEKLALLLLTVADGNRALTEEAIWAVANEGISKLPDVLNYIVQKKRSSK